MELQTPCSPQRKKEMEEAKAADVAEAKLPKEAKEEGIQTKPALPITTTSSSPCSSPSHEFSFTISFHSPSTTATTTTTTTKSPSTLSRCSMFDLAPADDIFFHGHLLPLQLLSRPTPISPRTSRVSQDASPAIPPAHEKDADRSRSNGAAEADAVASSNSTSSSSSSTASSNGDSKERIKNRLLSSLFGGVGKWRKGSEAGEREQEDEEKKRKKTAFDAMSRLLKRYVSAMEPLFSFRGGRGRHGDLRRRPYSFAGNTTARAVGREDWRRRRGELSAPASMRTSPANSGLLVATASVGGSSDESTMEELQSAIESAIAHCKSSIAMKDEKCKC